MSKVSEIFRKNEKEIESIEECENIHVA